jgi:CHASE2 domain-containing sensor protein/predicted Ser/Thr protein kinase
VASKLARFSWLPGGLAATVVLAIGRLIAPDSGLALETKLYDRIHRSAKVAPSADIVVVSIDRASIDKLGKWPWGFDVHATAIERLREAGASVIGWAVPFGSVANSADLQRIRDALSLLESSGFGNAEKAQELRQLLRAAAAGSSASAESRLAKTIQTHGRVVLPVELRLTREATTNSELPTSLLIGTNNAPRTMQAMQLRLPEESFLRAASAVGHLAFAADADGTVRSDTVAVRSGYDSIPSLAAAVATEALGLAPNDIVVNATSLRIGDRAIPLDSQQRMLPQYFPRAAFKELPFWRVWSGEVSSDELRGKIVLIGFPDAEISEAATLATPIGAHLPDVLAIASSTSSILDATYYSRPTSATAIEWFAMLAVVLAAAFLLPATGIAIGAVASAVIVAALGITEIGLLSSVRIWPQLALPAAAMVGGYFLYVVGELIRRANVRSSAQSKDSTASLRTLGQTFQRQGQLDLAFETYRRCPLDAPTMELLYQLGLDFERRRQNQRAAAVYGYIATRDPNYRDLRMRRARVKEDVEREVPRPRIETPAADPEPVRPQTRPPATSSRPGTRTLGRYEIEREIGKGAMGVVYLGRDPKINRVVAIKAIPLAEEFEEDDLEEARARFFREAEMAGRLNHPAIVTVYDAGEDQGLAYIAMEYLRGQHLSYYTDPARLLPPGTVLSLIARVADALHYAHRQNVVHRDIKPANIMFNSDTDELKITDFGIARLTDTSRTKTGIVLGTPSFMSPEQLEGRSLDGRSDQFALAVSLYQLLCGQLPFRAESMPRLMQKIATEPHPPIRSVRPELPECIEPILDRALAKSADDRYPTCAEFAAALRACAQQLAPPKRAQAEHEWLLP